MKYVKRERQKGYELEIVIYPAPAIENHTKKGKRQRATGPEQQKNNDKYAAWKLQGLIMANFAPGIDQFVTLTHPDKTPEADARRKLGNALKFFRGWCRKHNRKFRYIEITEKQGQWHHHLIMSYIPEEVIRDYWARVSKRVTISTLDPDNGYFDLVNYLLNSEKPSKDPNAPPAQKANAKRPRKKNEKRWSCSHGLLEPEDNIRILERMPKKKPRAPKGYRLDENSIQVVTDQWGTRMTCRCVWVGQGLPTAYEKTRARAIQERILAKASTKPPPRKTVRKKE